MTSHTSAATIVAPLIGTVSVPLCPVCGGSQRTRIATGQDYEYQTCGNEWHIWECGVCTHAWLDPRPGVDTMGTIYPPNYYSYDYEKSINPIAVRGKAFLDSRKFLKLLSFLNRPIQSYLDVGCSTGRFLRLAEKFGVEQQDAAGIELSAPLIQKLREEGFSVECAKVEESSLVAQRRFDLVTMFHVLEHVADPKAVADKLASAINEGGILAIETPNLQSWDAKLFRDRYWGGYHFPRHWHIFTPKSLTKLLRESGLDIVAVHYQTGHAFWLFSLHQLLRYGKNMPGAASMVHPLRSLPALIMVTAFDLVRALLGFKTSAMTVVARKCLRGAREAP